MKKLTKQQKLIGKSFIENNMKNIAGSLPQTYKISTYINDKQIGLFMQVKTLMMIGDDLGLETEWYRINTNGSITSDPEKEFQAGNERALFINAMKEITL